uniref:Uncharacterized protein n=1 Tax=Arundo donax TaxID=35708 RepID=A0A0A9F9Y1_ARUDO
MHKATKCTNPPTSLPLIWATTSQSPLSRFGREHENHRWSKVDAQVDLLATSLRGKVRLSLLPLGF